MAIYLPTYANPFVWTKESWEAYRAFNKSEMRYLRAYSSTIGIFAIFSPKKNRELKNAQIEYREKRDKYLKAVSDSRKKEG